MLGEASEVSPKGTDQLLVDRDACMGSGNCVFWAPGVFDADDEGVAVVCESPVGREEEIRRAIVNCPTKAISIGEAFPR
ncbi:MAG: ferredoxin [Acidimicrobiales bacterium]